MPTRRINVGRAGQTQRFGPQENAHGHPSLRLKGLEAQVDAIASAVPASPAPPAGLPELQLRSIEVSFNDGVLKRLRSPKWN